MSYVKFKSKLPFDSPRFGDLTTPLLIVGVDAEEEFDWTKPFRANSFSVHSMRAQELAQRIMEKHGVTPIYLCDYAVAAQPEGYGVLRDWLKAGRCVVGAQLHPWVNPPYHERVNEFNSYTCNLPNVLALEKLRALTDKIEENFGERPIAYKAGRNGADRSVVNLLHSLGYKIDLSFNPIRDYRSHKGPDHTIYPHAPFWLDRNRRILSIPGTGDVQGILRPFWPAIGGLAWSSTLDRIHFPTILSRLQLIDRAGLTPEGVSLKEAKHLTRAMFRHGHRIFSLSYHSPSLVPGNTPYVRSQRDLELFLGWLDDYLAFFKDELGGRGTTPHELYARCQRLEAANRADVSSSDARPSRDVSARGGNGKSEIAVFDFLSHAAMHHAFNESYVRTLRAAFPGDVIRFHAIEGQIEHLAKRLTDLEGVEFIVSEPFRVPFGFSRHNAIAGYWAAQACSKAIANAIRDRPTRLVSVLGVEANLFSVVGQGWSPTSPTPLHMILHGQLGEAMVWRSRNPFTRSFDFVSRISTSLPQGVKLVALELGVAEAIGELSPTMATSLETLEHPVLTAEWGHAAPANLREPLKIAFLGHTRLAKGFGTFLELARSANKSDFQFHAIGISSDDIAGLDLGSLHRLPSQSGLSRQTYLDLLASVDVVCLPLHSRAYEFTASGTVSDAIAGLKPLIALRNRTLDALVSRYGEIGYLVDSKEALFSLFDNFNREEFAAAYPVWTDNLRKIRAARAPAELGQYYAMTITSDPIR